MNIEKLAKHLKEFTLDEIEMIAECDCKTELKHLLNDGKLVLENDLYKFQEVEILTFDIFAMQKCKNCEFGYKFSSAVNYFLVNYVKINCKKSTYRKYCNQFKSDIIPYFKNKNIDDIEIGDIYKFYQWCIEREFKPLKIKNTLVLLKQLIKYFQEQGFIEPKCVFQVRRITRKNKFDMSRLVFKNIL